MKAKKIGTSWQPKPQNQSWKYKPATGGKGKKKYSKSNTLHIFYRVEVYYGLVGNQSKPST